MEKTTPGPSLLRRGEETVNPSLLRREEEIASPLLAKEGLGVVKLFQKLGVSIQKILHRNRTTACFLHGQQTQTSCSCQHINTLRLPT
jgi:hypothetical protein